MDLSCESVSYTEDSMRPVSRKFVELHVLFVPADQWNMKLNKVPAEATESFISAGFIRVYPETTLQTLRGELGALLGMERSVHKFSFLKCVGRSLALVKSKQEMDLKVKTFAPPYAAQPELYLLPTAEADSSFCSQSFTTVSSSSSPEQQVRLHPSKTTGTKKPIKFPHIQQGSQQPVPVSRLEEEHGDEDGGKSCSSLEEEEEEEEEEEAPSFIRREVPENGARKPQNQRALQLVTLRKALERCEADSALAMWSSEKEETWRKTKHRHRDTLSGEAGSPEDQDLGFSLTDSCTNSKAPNMEKSIRNKPTNGVLEGPAALSQPVQCSASPQSPDLATNKAASVSPAFPTNREAIMEEIKLVREERKQLEWTRQQLLRKGKDLLAQNRHRRNQARDTWKKKYFETKKATAPLEEQLRNLRQELEIFYNKVLHQLHAREKARRQGRSPEKNELIIQIMRESYEIDNLRRKVEDAEMKLITEIKLRKQAAAELRDLKAELTQKRNSHILPGRSGNSTWDKTQA